MAVATSQTRARESKKDCLMQPKPMLALLS
ncbi:hypothetical protein J2785_006753 [Burkholderia ambifaria]|nr:hypothetical protein [Burkholderia ambifaria]